MRQEGGARTFWAWLGFDSPADRAHAGQLVMAASSAARQPGFYGSGRVADTFTGRFELMCVFAALVTRRLHAIPEAARLGQAFSNALFSSFDAALREAGEGDLSVAKRMKGLARANLGRVQAYSAALDAGSAPDLAAALSRNVWNEEAAPFAAPLANYVIEVERALAALSPADLAVAERWPAWRG
jgi:cytochrome b pre-mRNA-processing protein 3